MKNGNDKPHAVGVGLVLKFKGEVVAVEQFQSAPRVGNADAAFFYGGLRDVVLAVAAMEDYRENARTKNHQPSHFNVVSFFHLHKT